MCASSRTCYHHSVFFCEKAHILCVCFKDHILGCKSISNTSQLYKKTIIFTFPPSSHLARLISLTARFLQVIIRQQVNQKAWSLPCILLGTSSGKSHFDSHAVLLSAFCFTSVCFLQIAVNTAPFLQRESGKRSKRSKGMECTKVEISAGVSFHLERALLGGLSCILG